MINDVDVELDLNPSGFKSANALTAAIRMRTITVRAGWTNLDAAACVLIRAMSL